MTARACAAIVATAVLGIGPWQPVALPAPIDPSDTPRELNPGELHTRADRYGKTPEPYLFPPKSAPEPERSIGAANPPSLLAVSEALNDVYSTGNEALKLAKIDAPTASALGTLWDYGLACQNAAEVARQKGEHEGQHALAKECAATFVGNSIAPVVGGVVVAGGSWAITGACVGFLAKKFGQTVVRVGYDFARDLWNGKMPESTLGDYVEGTDLPDPLMRWQRKNAYFKWARDLAHGDMPTEADFRIANRDRDAGLAPGQTGDPSTGRPYEAAPPSSRPGATLPPSVSRALGTFRDEIPSTVSFDGRPQGSSINYSALSGAIREIEESPTAGVPEATAPQTAGDAILRPLQNEVRGTMVMESLADEAITAENAHRRAVHHAQILEAQRRDRERKLQQAIGNAIGQALAGAIEREIASDKRPEERSRRKNDSRENHRTEPQRRGDQKPRSDSAARQCTPGCR